MRKALVVVLLSSVVGMASVAKANESAPQMTLSLPGGSNPELSLMIDSVPWDKILDQGNDGSVVFGVQILGPSPYSRNPGTYFKPASTSKLFTATSALSRLGPDYRFKTTLQWNEVAAQKPGVITSLTLIGGGDPTWGLDQFGERLRTRVDRLAAELKKRGIAEIRGPIQIIPDDPRWAQLRYPEGWEKQDHFNCGGARAQGFNLQGNCATFTITSPSRGYWEEYGVSVPVTLDLRSGSSTDIDVVETSDGYEVRGRLRKSRSASVTLPVKNTEAWVKKLFIRSLDDQGIDVREDQSASAQGEAQSVVMESPTLGEILKPFLKNSFNFLGDALFKIVGRHFGPENEDLVSASQSALRDFVAEIGAATAFVRGFAPIQGFFSDQVTLLDGSGLSRQSQVTTTALVTLLEDAKHRADFNALWDALPIAGVDGTLRNRMRKTAAQGVLRAKTGTLRGVYNLSGYVPRFAKGGGIDEFIPFVVLTETTVDESGTARAAEDRVGAALAKAVNP